MGKNIGLWLDTTSEGSGNAKWVVSLEEGDCTRTLASFDDEERAVDYAGRCAEETGLDIVRS